MTTTLTRAAKSYLSSLKSYSRKGTGILLRPYQLDPGNAIIHSIQENLGMTFVIIMPRQSGKDELMSQLKGYLMRSLSYKDRGIVEVNPTYKPQTINAIMRLETRLNMNPMTFGLWKKRSDFIRQVGYCRTSFLSGDGQANVVGATASLLLVVNEAQDIEPHIYDKKFAPMCASTNATRVFCGTVWTSTTLLSRECRSARLDEERDGFRRVFAYNANDVIRSNRSYGRYVRGEVKRLGRQHPMIKTQYYNEEIDAQAGMFNPARRALMQGDQLGYSEPIAGTAYAFLIDVAGQDESKMSLKDDNAALSNTSRDSTTLSIVSIDLSSLALLQAPTYRTIYRQAWTGSNHLAVFGALRSLGDAWQPQHIAIDATGVGEGLWAMLDKVFPGRVIPIKFTQQQKSDIGWRYLAIIETGRYRDCCPTDQVRIQYDYCVSEILPGPAKTLRWGVPDGTRGPDGELVHDDFVLADSLTAILDELDWSLPTEAQILRSPDPLTAMERNF